MSKIIWLTGLSGAGKSTLSHYITKVLKKKKFKVKLIDGDIFRKNKKYKNVFSKKSIVINNLKIINYINKIKFNYDYVIVAVISPIAKTRKKAKNIFKDKYFEVFIKCKISVLKKRDTKGLYFKADKKIIKNLIGYKSKIKYEKSNYKVIKIETDKLNLEESCKYLLKKILN